MAGDIMDFVAARGIQEVVHFTTHHGLLGVLAAGAVLSRRDLNDEQLLDSVRLLNCDVRRDPEWTGYINMSISVVNDWMFGRSRGWHARDNIWWAVLSFTPAVLADPGVYFTTTNNTYTDTVRRGTGLTGLADLYSDSIPYGYYNSVSRRRPWLPDDRPTNAQAEVLYPGRLMLDRLQAIYVPEEQHLDEIEGWVAALPKVSRVPVTCRPEVFQ